MPLLEVHSLSKSFGGLQALNGVDLSVERGHVLGLVGPNGSGKTTLLNIVTGFLPATSGSVLLDGRDVLGTRPEALVRLGLARTFQEAMTFPDLSARENVMAGMFLQSGLNSAGAFVYSRKHRTEKARLRREADAVLERVGFAAKPDNLAGDLGVGEQKHLGIAIAVAASPRLLMLDEPAAGMADVEVERLHALLVELRESGITTVLVEHNMELVMAVCDRVVVLDFGAKIAEGPPSQVRNDQKVIAAYLGTKAVASASR